jgi:hypothetical protein
MDPRPDETTGIGIDDLTVILFGYYDFRADKIIVEDELVYKGQDLQLPKLVEDVKNKEKQHWYNILTNEVRSPYLRVSDINYIVTNEILRYSNNEMNFIAAKKDDNQAAINTLRVLLASKKIIINPRCQTLIKHLRNVKWASINNKNTFARSPDEGHYDAVDALKYFVRHINYSRNPYPAHYQVTTKDYSNTHTQTKPTTFESQAHIYKQIFGLNRLKK